jgi:AcrR family transcriptional regulator
MSMADAFNLDPPAEQGARRRAQLIRVVTHLVVTRGVDKVTHASVADLAGCARSLVYRYFPRREDMLYAPLAAFDEQLVERFGFDGELPGMLQLEDVRPGDIPAQARDFVARLWRDEDWETPAIELRLANVILMRDSSLSGALGEHRVALQESMERRLLGPLRGLGLTDVEAWIVVDAMLSALYHATRAVWVGEMKPDEAIDLITTVSSRALQTLTRERRAR